MPVDISDIENILRQAEIWRQTQTINLIASENTPSEAVRRVQNSDFMGRYAEGHPNEGDRVNRYYQGTRYIEQIERMAHDEIIELFGIKQADVRPISGNAANTAIALGWLRGGDTIVANSTDAGGHISHGPVGVFGRRIQSRGQSLKLGGPNSINLHYLPLTEDHYHIDAQKSIELIERVSPQLVVMGKSLFLFPEPVTEVAAFCKTQDIPLLYDAAHVLGLIAGGEFQQTLHMGPGDADPRNPSGLRIGVPEMTRFGMDERAMGELAQLIHDAIREKNVKEQVHALRGRFVEMKYV